MIRVEMVGNKIHLVMPYSERNKDACKSVRGARWANSSKAWTYPLSFDTCVEIRNKVATRLKMPMEIGPELNKWAKAEKERLAAIPDVQSMELAELPRLEKVNPMLHKALQNRPYQTVGASFIAHRKAALIADDMGLGKTPQVIAAVQEANLSGPILIIAPSAAASLTWPDQLEGWAPGEPYTLLTGLTPAARAKTIAEFRQKVEHRDLGSPKRQWLIVNPYWVMCKAELDQKGSWAYPKDKRDQGIGMKYKLKDLFEMEWAAIIIDEAHDQLAMTSMNRKKWRQDRIGCEALNLKPGGLRIAMSGTPMKGKKQRFFGTLQWLRPEHYTGYYKWASQHFHIDPITFEVGALKSEEALYAELREVMLRRTKNEVAKDLPAIIYGGTRLDPHDENSPVGVWLHMNPIQEVQYKQMLESGSTATDNGVIMANGHLAEATRLKQFATLACDLNGEDVVPLIPSAKYPEPSNKIEWIVQFLEERGISAKPDGDGKVIIASQFARVCSALQARLSDLGIPSHKLIGATSPAKRRDIMEDFQKKGDENSVRVFILSTKAGGVSLTLDQADDVIIMDETFNPDDQAQVEARAHRVSRTDHQVSVWYLRSLGTIEEAIAAVTTQRGLDMSQILDKSRGLELLKVIKEYKPKERKKA